jgi:hypothetical protein
MVEYTFDKCKVSSSSLLNLKYGNYLDYEKYKYRF